MKYPEPFLLATDKGASCRHAVHRGYLPGAKGRAEEGSLDIWDAGGIHKNAQRGS